MKTRTNQHKVKGVTAAKKARRTRNFAAHRGQWVHCHGSHCSGDKDCKCREMGPPCWGGCYMVTAK